MIAIGDKVICIRDEDFLPVFTPPIVKGKIYVIRDMVMGIHSETKTKALALFLVGIRGNIDLNGMEWCASALNFRKLDDIKEINRLKNQLGEPVEIF